jgi:hypothetical protein
MASSSGSFSTYPAYVQLRTESNIASRDEANNRTLVRTSVYIDISGGGASSSGGSVNLSVNGVGTSGSFGSVNWANGAHVVISNFDVWVNHNANGEQGNISFSASGSAGGWGSASNGSSLGGFSNYDRSPGIPAFSYVTRTTDSLAVGVNTVSSPAGTATYYIERSENDGAWADSRTGRTTTYSGLAQGSSQRFRSRASNSDGYSGYSYSAYYAIPSVPSAPSIGVSVPSSKSLTVAAGTSAANGATVTSYSCEASPDDGATWLGSDPMTSRSLFFEGLQGGATYRFRVFSANEMGESSRTTSSSVFVPSGGKRWNGSAFVPTSVARRFTASGWQDLTVAKRFTASGWEDLS